MAKASPQVPQGIGDLPLARRIEMLSGSDFWHTTAIPEIGVPSIMLTDGPHGVRRQPDDADHLGIGDSIPATCFPTASALGATWDAELIGEIGAAIGRECRAHGVGVLLGPGLNIKRHPGGGRNFEYFSEDPVVSGTLAAAMTRGLQSEGVGACLKHFVANNHESYRMVVDVVVDERTLRELYLRGFEIAVVECAPWAVMTSYNQVNGEYVSDSARLVGDVLRREWGFGGAVMTDWGGINDRVRSVRAGVDLEMPSSGGAHDSAVERAVETGDLDDDEVTRRADTVAELARRVTSEAAERPHEAVDEVAHHRLARRVAAAGSVLLTNDGTLPLDRATNIAIIGAFADHPRYQGAGSSQVAPTRLDDARRALEERMTGSVRFARGYDPDTGASDRELIGEATRLAQQADVAIVFVGVPAIDEAEGYDRASLALPPTHDELVTSVCAANPHTVVVLSNGAPVLLPWAERPAAILETYLGGQAGGSAIADVIVGEREPGGRLAESFPASMVFPSEENFLGCKREMQYREGLYIGYRFHDTAGVAARFAFGHGLSYTTFDWSEASVTGHGCDLTVEVAVTNTGDRAGSEVVQVYVRDVESTVYRPDKELRAFAKVHLDVGEASTVRLDLDRRAFAYYDADVNRNTDDAAAAGGDIDGDVAGGEADPDVGDEAEDDVEIEADEGAALDADDGIHDADQAGSGAWRIEGGEFTILVGASSTDIRREATVVVDGDDDITTSVRAGPGHPRFVATDAEFESMLGHPIPEPTPVLPFTINTVVEELDATRLGRVAKAGFLKLAHRQTAKMLGDDPDPVLAKLSETMIREAPLRFLVSMSGGAGSIKAFDGLTKLLSTLRITGRRG